MDKKDLPLGVKIIAVFYQILGLYLSIFWVLIVVLLKEPGTFLSYVVGFGLFGLSEAGGFIGFPSGGYVAILYILYGPPLFLVGRALWKKQKWSKGAAVGFAAFGAILSFFSIEQSQSIFNIFKNILIFVLLVSIAIYLLFSSKVKTIFSYKKKSK